MDKEKDWRNSDWFARVPPLLKDVMAALPAGAPAPFGPILAQIIRRMDGHKTEAVLQEIRSLSTDQRKMLEADLKLGRHILELVEEIRESRPKVQMTAVVPTGGLGESLFPITTVIPKCLIPIGRRPMLHHILRSLHSANGVFKKAIVLTRGFSEAIEESVGQSGCNDFVECRRIEKEVPAALQEIRAELEGSPFLLHYNDILIEEIDWPRVLKCHVEQRASFDTTGMLLCSQHYPLKIGIVNEGKPDRLGSFLEKPLRLPQGYANMGVAVFEPEFLNYVEPEDKGIFENTLKRAMEARRNFGLFRVGEWHHVDSIRDYHRAKESPFGRGLNPV